MPKTTAKPKGAAKAEAAEKSQAVAAKSAARAEQEAKFRAYVESHYVDGDEKLSAVAEHLKITSGKAAFIAMLIRVERGEVPAIKAKNDDDMVDKIVAARKKADEYSSWGWLAARSGKSEVWIKGHLESAGLFQKRAEQIASVRKANAPAKPKAAAASNGKKVVAGKKKVSGNA